MNWKKWRAFNPYKKLWSVLGGRPWTYITRDLWHKAEFVWIIGLVLAGVWLGKSFEWPVVLAGAGILTVGFFLGHVFWGTEYKDNQPGR